MKLISLILFTSTLYAECYNPVLKKYFSNSIVSELAQCNVSTIKDSNLSSFCDCQKKIKSPKSSTKEIISSHNKILANAFESRFNIAIASIANDLDTIEAFNINSSEKKALAESCNIEKQLQKSGPNGEMLEKCYKNENTFSSLFGGVESFSGKTIARFDNIFKIRSQKHRNVTGSQESCTPFSSPKPFVDRCESKYEASCEIPDKLTNEVHNRKLLKDLKSLIKFARKTGTTVFDKSMTLADQLTDTIFSHEKNLDARISKLEELNKDPIFGKILNSKDTIPLLNSTSEKDDELSLFHFQSSLKNSNIENIKKKCNTSFKEAIAFLCKEVPSSKTSNLNLPIPELRHELSNIKNSSYSFLASKYYCKRQDKNDQNVNPFKSLEDVLHPQDRVSRSPEELAGNTYSNQTKKSRDYLCSNFYGRVNKKAKKLGLKQENLTDPDDQFKLYSFQLKEYSKILEEQCPNGKFSEKCSYLVELVSITEKNREIAINNQKTKAKDIQEAKDKGIKYVNKGYLVENTSLAESILTRKLTTPTKKKSSEKKSEETKSNEKDEDQTSKEVKQSPKVTFSSSSSSSINNSIEPIQNTTLAFSSSPTNQVETSSSNLILNSSNSPSQKYWEERSKRIDEDIKKAQEYLNNLTEPEKKAREERIKEAKFDQATRTLTKALKPTDYIQEQRHINQHTLQDEGRIPTSTKIKNPTTHDLRKLENKILNETINSGVINTNDRVELSKFEPTQSGLINKHKLVDKDGNVLSITEVKIKGSIEEDFTKVLEKDDEKNLTKDRKMILANPSQDSHFKNLAKALSKKETFLISRYDNEDIKLIVKYNHKQKKYSVEPYADRERLKIYEQDYLEFQKNISNAISDKTFNTLMKKYKTKELE